MKKSLVIMLAVFLLEAPGQLLGGVNQIVTGTFQTIANPTAKMIMEPARWAGHYEYVEQGNDASGMSVTG